MEIPSHTFIYTRDQVRQLIELWRINGHIASSTLVAAFGMRLWPESQWLPVLELIEQIDRVAGGDVTHFDTLHNWIVDLLHNL